MHRVRMSLPYFSEFGWSPVVLALKPEEVEGVKEPLLLETIPSDIPIRRVQALPLRYTKNLGIRNAALRAMPFLYQSGCELIKKYEIDLVYFSTTSFPIMTLGRLWRKKFGVPFVIDMQDPWVNNFQTKNKGKTFFSKYQVARLFHRVLEPWTMKKVSGIIAVSRDYIQTLEKRYPRVEHKPRITLPFGFTKIDFEILQKFPQENRFFKSNNKKLHGVYVGRGGKDLRSALQIIFGALKIGLQKNNELFSKIKMYFLGTDYAPDQRARKTILPVAEEMGISNFIEEDPFRLPYFEALQLLKDADFLIVPGSEDSQYTASKIYPYILAKKPVLAIFHEKSSIVEVLKSTQAGEVVTFSNDQSVENISQSLFHQWSGLLQKLPFEPATNWLAFEKYSALEMTRKQCELFDQVAHGS